MTSYRDLLKQSCDAEQEALKYPVGSPRYNLYMAQGWQKLEEAKAAPKVKR